MNSILRDNFSDFYILTLSRPGALNALNEEMINAIDAALSVGEKDNNINIVFRGDGDRAFCAGGDIKAARLKAIHLAQGLIPLSEVTDFFAREYALNRRLYHYSGQTMAYMDGITMGGGVGIANACGIRIATEKTVWAMPETGIGFFPDVGAAYYLARAPHFSGRYLALTGLPVSNAGDLVKCDLATHYMESDEEETFLEELVEKGLEIVELFSRKPPAPELPYDKIERCFSSDNVGEILDRLDKAGDEWSRKTAAVIRTRSPISLTVALRHVVAAERESFDQVIDRDLALASYFMQLPDFIEGVRAAVVDKDRQPRWNPVALDQVDIKSIQSFFN